MDINTYILTESNGNFKTFLKENYAIALCSCYMLKKNVEHRTEHDADNAYEVCIH